MLEIVGAIDNRVEVYTLCFVLLFQIDVLPKIAKAVGRRRDVYTECPIPLFRIDVFARLFFPLLWGCR